MFIPNLKCELVVDLQEKSSHSVGLIVWGPLATTFLGVRSKNLRKNFSLDQSGDLTRQCGQKASTKRSITQRNKGPDDGLQPYFWSVGISQVEDQQCSLQ